MSHAHRRSREESQLASIPGIPPENVYVHATFIGGGFGGRGGWGKTGALQITQVPRIAPALNGKPGKLLWRPETDFRLRDSHRPAGGCTVQAALDAGRWPDTAPLARPGDH